MKRNAPDWVQPSLARRAYAAGKVPRTTYTGAMRVQKRMPYSTSIPRAVPSRWAPFGQSTTIKMKYCDYFSINPPIGGAADYVFSANGLYDPNITGTGHQPYAFDTSMTLYNHATVIGSKIKVSMWNNQTALPVWLIVALRDSAASLTATPSDNLREQPGVVSRLSSPGGNGSSSDLIVVTNRFSAKRFFRARDVVGSEEFRNTAAANPTEQAYFHVCIAPQNGTDDLGLQTLNVEIEYIVVLHEPKILPQS